jgi:hypothetical protein
MADRKLLVFAAILLTGGQVIYQVAEHFHPEGGATANEVFILYARSPSWALVHEAQFLGSVVALLGLAALCHALNTGAGVGGMMNRCAAALTIAALALNATLYAVDGVGLKQATDAWLSAPPAEQSGFYAVVQGIRGIEWGMRSYVDLTTGLALVVVAYVVIATARIPRIIGALMGISGLAYIVQGYGYGAGYTSISDHFVLSSSNYQLLMTVWALWLLVVAWRMKGTPRAALAQEHV